MVELSIVVAVLLLALGLGIWDLRASKEDIGRLSQDLENTNNENSKLKKALKHFARALGKPTATGAALVARWRARLPNRRGTGPDGGS